MNKLIRAFHEYELTGCQRHNMPTVFPTETSSPKGGQSDSQWLCDGSRLASDLLTKSSLSQAC